MSECRAATRSQRECILVDWRVDSIRQSHQFVILLARYHGSLVEAMRVCLHMAHPRNMFTFGTKMIIIIILCDSERPFYCGKIIKGRTYHTYGTSMTPLRHISNGTMYRGTIPWAPTRKVYQDEQKEICDLRRIAESWALELHLGPFNAHPATLNDNCQCTMTT